MTEHNEEADFHDVLGIEAGRELAIFPLALRQMLTYEEMDPEVSGLLFFNELYESLLPEVQERNFQALLEKGLVDKSEPPGAGTVLDQLLLIETRMQGSVAIPPEWTPDSFTMSFSSGDSIGDPRSWWIYLREGVSFYTGQRNAGFDALIACTKYLFAREDDLEQAALYLWDEIGQLQYKKDWGGVIDGLRLADSLPPQHYRVERILEGYRLLSSERPGVRYAAASLLEKHQLPDLAEKLKALAVAETATLVAELQVLALRLIGGQAGFDALLEVAQHAILEYVAKLANRALAWVADYPERASRIRKLCFSKESRLSAIGSVALSESKYHSVFAYGGVLASADERMFAQAFVALMDDHASAGQLLVLQEAFANGKLLVDPAIEALAAGSEADGAQVLTRDGVLVLLLRKEHLEAGRLALARVLPALSAD